MTAALELKNIEKSYVQGDKSLSILQGINLTVRKGEMISLVGSALYYPLRLQPLYNPCYF